MTNKERFLQLVSNEETNTIERAKLRMACKDSSTYSNLVAFSILNRLDELGWTQLELAEKLSVSQNQVKKWVKGNEKFSLDILEELSIVLEVNLIQLVPNIRM